MGLIIKSPASSFTKNLGTIAYPVTRGLVGLYYLGSSRANQLLNGVAGGAKLSVVGAPVVGGDYATCRYNAGYDTGLPETADFSFIAVAEFLNTAINSALMMGNNNNDGTDADQGSDICQSNTQIETQVGVTGNTTTRCYRPSTNLTAYGAVAGDPCFFGCSVDSAAPWGRTYTGTRGYFGYTQTALGTRSLDTSRSVMLGHRNSTAGYDQAVKMYAAAVHNVALTDGEMVLITNFLRTQYRLLGITTL